MDYINIVIATMLLAVSSILTKYYQKRAGTSLVATLWFNVLGGVFTLVIFFFVAGCKLNFTPFSLIVTGAVSLLIGSYSMIGMKLISMGKIAVYILFLMLGGMIIPLLYGLFFLGEEMSWLRWMGLVLLIVSMILTVKNDNNKETDAASVTTKVKQKKNFTYILLCMCVFVINGFVSIGSKMHQIESTYATVSEIDYVTLTGLGKLVIFGVPLFACLLKDRTANKRIFTNKQTLIYLLLNTLVYAAVVGISFILQLNSASNIPASALFPMITGGNIVFTAIASAIVFKERLSKQETCGIVLCMLATLMFL